MINKELLNKCYKFFNRFITANELVDELYKIDNKELSKEDIKETNKLIEDIKIIISKTSNEPDEYVTKRKEKIKQMIEKVEEINKAVNNDKINKQLEGLKEDYESEMDSHERWFEVTKCINENDYFNKAFESLSDYELLEFIAQYIKAPFPPQISQEEFDRLVKVGIEKDEREWLWRLAFNYEGRNINLDEIVYYYIEKKDGYYLSELISAVGSSLNIDDIISNIKDNDLIKDLKDRKDVISAYVSEEQLNKLKGE